MLFPCPQLMLLQDPELRLRKLEAAAAAAQSGADNAWMLVSAALVLLMTGPGLALFYSGLVRRKNVLGTMMQSFAMMALVTVLWAVAGYSLVFDAGGSVLGGLHHVFLRGVGLTPDPDYSTWCTSLCSPSLHRRWSRARSPSG